MNTDGSLRSRRTVLAGGIRLGCAALLAGPLTAATAARAAAGAVVSATVLASGPGVRHAGGTLLRGCSAVATAVEGVGGSLRPGMALDFRRDLALLVTGADPLTIRADAGAGTVQAEPGPAWALVSVTRRGRALPWRLRIGGLATSVHVETSHW